MKVGTITDVHKGKGNYIRTPEILERLHQTRMAYQLVRKSKAYANHVCENCGSIFSARTKLGRRFCSNRCKTLRQLVDPSNHGMWRGGKLKIPCVNCRETVDTKPYKLKTNKNIFCSYRCNNQYKNAHQVTHRTDIEVLMAKQLGKLGLKYIEQYVVPKIAVADFYLPEHGLLIFCDGEYWHNYPQGKPFDSWQVLELRKRGFNVVRLWGDEIRQMVIDPNPIAYLGINI